MTELEREELSGMSNIIAGLNQRLFDACKQRDEFGELIGVLKGENERLRGGWLDISSVPRDTWVLVNRVMYSGRAIAQLIDETDEGYGMTWFDDEMNVLEFVPTKWQPLPPEPTNNKQG